MDAFQPGAFQYDAFQTSTGNSASAQVSSTSRTTVSANALLSINSNTSVNASGGHPSLKAFLFGVMFAAASAQSNAGGSFVKVVSRTIAAARTQFGYSVNLSMVVQSIVSVLGQTSVGVVGKMFAATFASVQSVIQTTGRVVIGGASSIATVSAILSPGYIYSMFARSAAMVQAKSRGVYDLSGNIVSLVANSAKSSASGVLSVLARALTGAQSSANAGGSQTTLGARSLASVFTQAQTFGKVMLALRGGISSMVKGDIAATLMLGIRAIIKASVNGALKNLLALKGSAAVSTRSVVLLSGAINFASNLLASAKAASMVAMALPLGAVAKIGAFVLKSAPGFLANLHATAISATSSKLLVTGLVGRLQAAVVAALRSVSGFKGSVGLGTMTTAGENGGANPSLSLLLRIRSAVSVVAQAQDRFIARLMAKTSSSTKSVLVMAPLLAQLASRTIAAIKPTANMAGSVLVNAAAKAITTSKSAVVYPLRLLTNTTVAGLTLVSSPIFISKVKLATSALIAATMAIGRKTLALFGINATNISGQAGVDQFSTGGPNSIAGSQGGSVDISGTGGPNPVQ